MYKLWVNKEGGSMSGKYYDFKTFKVYWAYRKRIAEEIAWGDFNESFTGKFLSNGFKPNRGIQPTINWFGVSKYEPNLYMIKGNKSVHLSLQGIGMPYPDKVTEGINTLLHKCECKYIGMFIDKKPIYQDWTGRLPKKELIDEFLTV